MHQMEFWKFSFVKKYLPNAGKYESITVYSMHVVNIFLLYVQHSNLAELPTLVQASQLCFKNSDCTILQKSTTIKVWQTLTLST